tara:strand:- start:90377 stop:90505 length:129 start_codon:yes stop_codon:yes gene_type:complete
MHFERLNQIADRQRPTLRGIVLATVCLAAGVMELGLFLTSTH